MAPPFWPLPPPPPFGDPLVCAAGASVVVGADGVKTAGVAARQDATPELTASAVVGAAEFTVAFPAKLQDWALALVAR